MKGASIIVSTYNRSRLLRRALNSLLKQKAKAKYEIIVVDDGSTDNTQEVLKGYSKNRKVKAIKLESPRGPAIARNKGFAESKYPILIVMDDDCIASKRWLENMLKPFSDPHVGVSSHYYVKVNGQYVYGGTSTAYLKKALDIVGYFDPRYTAWPISFAYREDTDLVFRILDIGYKVVYPRGASFQHLRSVPIKLLDKMKYAIKRVWIHQSDVLLYKKHPVRSKNLLGVKFGFLASPLSDFKRATGLWEGDDYRVSSPQGVTLIKGYSTIAKIMTFVIGIKYAILLKLVRLIGSIRYGKLLL